ncbi:GlcNAc-PI de-N-acetylase [Nakamurella sp. YIM 132087]|uniref:GlcNAc-PI de-N-acetylase n=1 Tax=Nakamurella alba TaxID=2665158 RepID=A0A7K1FX65_9ACTN|nr:PIG-L family deacetylase [Nakamurella alba]MTD17424.1 GlcNAc-PI de-N-acetylase [Nakamurella alba]
MATLVSFQAHPDDESITTGGVMRKAADEGHRVVLVVATRGELGLVPGDLAEGESLADRRVLETAESARLLGAHRVEYLGYTDSGMAGDATNNDPGTFATADVEEAARRLADLLVEEDAQVLTIYDDHGGYGHPDHVQVHVVGARAAELAGTPRVYQATQNRDEIRAGMKEMIEANPDRAGEGPDMEFVETLGSPSDLLTARVDVSAWTDVIRASMRAHLSQIDEQHWFLTMPDEAFRRSFGVEWFIREGQGPGITETDLMAGL